MAIIFPEAMIIQGRYAISLQWRHNENDGVSILRRLNCLHNLSSGADQTSKLRVTGLCEGNSSVTDEFPVQKASNAQIASIWWRHHEKGFICLCHFRAQENEHY